MKKVLFLLVLISCVSFAQVTNTVTFVADISVLSEQGFTPGTHGLKLEGLNWDNGDISVVGDREMLQDPNNAMHYTVTLEITTTPDMVVGDSARWKFKAYPDEDFVDGGWESANPVTGYDGHAYVFQDNGSVVDLDPIEPWITMIQTGVGVQNTITFQADLSSMLGTGVGFFDPDAGDIMEVKGFWGDANDPNIFDAILVDGDPIMTPDPFMVGLYTTTLTIELPEGAVAGNGTGFKFKASPDERFSNTGWETSANRPIIFEEDGTSWTMDVIQPNITPLGLPLSSDITVLFQVNLVEGSANRYDGSEIPRDEVTLGIIKGASTAFGGWGGNWTLADTVAADSNCIVINDSGENGDKVAGDHIWSANVTFPAGTMQGASPYKYGIWYPGCDTIPGASGAPLDNSAPSGEDLSFNIQATAAGSEVLDIWPTLVTSVKQIDNTIPDKYTLEQNYPNPFNPETVIKYNIAEEGKVTMTVFNVLGESVATIVNDVQEAGTYQINFNGYGLSSGIYFYSLNVNGNVLTKKMMLLK